MKSMKPPRPVSTNLFAFLTLLIALSLGGWVSKSHASDYHSPRTAAIGGAGHAGPLLTDAIYLNPSFTSFVPTYMISASYSWYNGGTAASTDPSSTEGPLQGRIWNISLQDGRSELFQAGFGFTQRSDSRWIHLGASKAVARRLGFGVGAKFVLPNDPGKEIARDLTLSFSGIATEWLHTVIVADNLFLNDSSRAYRLQREITLGTKINVMGILLLYLDPMWMPDGSWVNGERFGWEAGMEIIPYPDLYVRLGTFRNSNIPYAGTRGKGYGLGFGWLAPRLSLDYSYQTIEEPLSASAHNLGFTVYF